MGNATNDIEDCPPTWLDNIFIEKALRAGGDSTIKVTSSEIKRATAAGDNYMSVMYRANVKMTKQEKQEEKSIIIKCQPTMGGGMQKFITESNVFDRETKAFTVAIPKIFRTLQGIYSDNVQPFAANYIHFTSNDEATTLILEDLKPQNFQIAERVLGLDKNHCLLVIRRIAQYHAASRVLFYKDPVSLQPFMPPIPDEAQTREFETFFRTQIEKFVNIAKEWPECESRYMDKLNELINMGVDVWIDGLRRDDSEFNVLRHGDLWANNMMFRYSEESGAVQDVRFVDFQLSHWAAPAIDLLYFLNSSAAPDVIENFEEIIDVYHQTLTETLSSLGHKHLQPTASEIRKQIERRRTYGILCAISIRSICLVDRTKIPDMNKCLENEESIHYSEACKESLRKLLPFYGKMGWL